MKEIQIIKTGQCWKDKKNGHLVVVKSTFSNFIFFEYLDLPKKAVLGERKFLKDFEYALCYIPTSQEME